MIPDGGRKNNINFDDYQDEMSQRQSHSSQNRFERFLPDKNILAKAFWMIIQASPFGVYTYLFTVILEDVAKVTIAALILVPNELDYFLGFDINSLNDKTISYNHAITNIIITGSFVGSILFSVFSIIYLYRALKANEEAESDALPQVIAKIQTIFFTFFGTFLSIGYQFFTVYTIYFVAYSNTAYVSSELKIIQIILSALLVILTIALIYVHDNFYNLMFINTILVCGRPSRSTSYVIKPAFIYTISALSIKPHMTHLESSLFLFLISTYSTVHLLTTAIARMYYERTLDKINLVLKIIKTASFITMLLVDLIRLSKKDLAIVFVLVTPCVWGVCVIFKGSTDKKIYDKLSHSGVAAFKDCGDLEHAIYIVLDFLEADDPINHSKFQGLVIANEERAKDEEQSYYQAIGKVIHLHEQLIEFGSIYEEDQEELKAAMMQQEDEEHTNAPIEGQNKQDTEIAAENAHNSNGGESIKMDEQKINSRNSSGDFKKKTYGLLSNNPGSYDQTTVGETVNHKLGDIFLNKGDQSNGVRRGQQIMMQRDKNVVKINGIDIDVSNLQQAIKMIKLRYVYEILVKQACQSHNEEIVFLLMKAYISMDLFHNKYLALTAITHVSVLSLKLSYKDQLISTISMNYFLKTILDKKGNQSSQHTSSTSWITQSLNQQTALTSELDSGLLLEQSLQIDETINYIKMCSYRIAQFWQITSSETVTSEQIATLQQISGEISQMLGHIRAYVKQMESIESLQSSCQTLCYYIAHFFTLVIRDKNMGNMIFRQMNLIGMLGRKQQKSNLIDEIGVAVVDGNFGLYGQIVFANKIFLKLLGYQTEQIQGKLIHCLMPSAVSEVHNLFWNAFSQMGIPKVLDQLRFLFVKDSKGYVAPFKIFIKFQFSPKYGYSFVGLFRRPSNVVFDEQDQSAKMKKTYQMICNQQGKILEISQSCRELMKLTPQIIETLHASMQENFLLSFFNQNLIINQMDFSKHSCVLFKNIPFNISLLKQFSQQFEFTSEDGMETEVDPFGCLKENFRCQMKIIKETYGNTNSTFVTLYYAIFTEVQALSSHTGMMTSNVMTGGESNNNALPQTKDSSMSGAKNDSEYASLQAINRGSNSEGSLMNTASMSSTASSSVYSQSENDIKMVEEGIDYDKLPKPMVFLQISTTFLFVCLIVLATVQYSINTVNEDSNIEYQRLLKRSLQNQELISQLTLMSRTYMNIKTGYEPRDSDYIQDRTTLLRPMALSFIEDIRTNLQNLHDFFKRLSTQIDSNGDGVDDTNQLNLKNVTMFSLLSNNDLTSRNLSRFYSLNMWLVNLYEVFIYDNFTSKIGTYENNNIQTQVLSSFDQTLFYILANGQYNLKTQFAIFIDTVEKLIDDSVNYTILLNKYYVGITSVLVILLIAMSIYFVAFVLRFKLSVLSFFSEIDRKSMLVNAHLAKEFYFFLVTDEKQQLEKSKRILDDFQQEKLTQLENELQAQSKFALLKELKEKRKMQASKTSKKSGKKVNVKEVFNVKKIKEEVKKGAKAQIVVESLSDDEVEDSEDESYEEEKQKGQKGSQNSKQSIKRGLSSSSKQGRKKKKKGDDFDSSDEEKKMDKNGIFEKDSKLQFTQLQASLSVKNKAFAERLQDKMMSDLSKMIIVGIITAIIIVAYFIGQLVLVSYNELQIQNNSQYIRTMLESMECTDEFVYQVRKLQISNSSWYKLDDKSVDQKIQFLPTLAEANNLNVTYQKCIKKNQKVDQLLQTYQNGKYQLLTKGQSNQTLCSYIQFNTSLGSINNSIFNQSTCERIYQGVLQKPILQSSSVFLQDSLYSAIRFMSPQISEKRAENYIRSQVASKQMIELVDSHTFCLQNGLRRYYSQVIDQIMSSLNFNLLMALFIIFMSVLVVVFFVIQIFVMKKMKVSFWHSFYILRLIPKDDIDRDFIKRINDYLSNA